LSAEAPAAVIVGVQRRIITCAHTLFRILKGNSR